MKIIVGAAIIVLIALLGSRTTFTRVKLPLAARHVYLTGAEYILIGLCLGDLMLGLLDQQALLGLDPLLFLALGWIGLMFGVQLEISRIERFPRQYFLLAMGQATITLVVCLLSFLFLVGIAGQFTSDMFIVGAITLSAIAVPTAQSSLVMIQKELGLRRSKVMEVLIFISGIDELVGLVVFGFLFCYVHEVSPVGLRSLISLQYLILSLGLGVVMGALLHILTRLRCSQGELLLFIVGSIVFCAGAAALLGVSPLFVSAVAGVVIANVRGAKERISRVLTSLERPYYIVVLILGGALLHPARGWVLVLVLTLVYVLVRLAGKWLGGYVGSKLFRAPLQLPSSIGLGLVSQGGMAAAMVVSFHRSIGGELADSILLLVFVAIIVNELISPFLTRMAIGKAS